MARAAPWMMAAASGRVGVSARATKVRIAASQVCWRAQWSSRIVRRAIQAIAFGGEERERRGEQGGKKRFHQWA